MTDETQEHATRSPSGSHGWRRCAGKINAERGRPDRVGIEAAEGTVFHDHAEIVLKTGIEPHFLLPGERKFVSGHWVEYNEEMAGHMLGGLDYLAALLTDEAILMVEQRVWIEPYTLEPGGFGTSDVCIIYPRSRKIIVFDWKYGKVAVSPIENDQLILYALGCWESFAGAYFDWDPVGIDVMCVIWQPRVPEAGGEWNTTMEWLLQEGNQIRIDAAATYPEDAKRTPGLKQCQYCKAKADCAEYAAYNLNLVGLRFEDIDEAIKWDVSPVPEPFDEWTPERRSFVWLHRKMFTKWLDALHDAIIFDAKADKETPFVKIVPGNAGRRAYKPGMEKEAAKVLEAALGKEKVWKTELISPAVAQDELGKKRYEELLAAFVTQSEPKPMLVPITDRRKALPSKMIHFDGIEEEETED